jgi:hypothetical protein
VRLTETRMLPTIGHDEKREDLPTLECTFVAGCRFTISMPYYLNSYVELIGKLDNHRERWLNLNQVN